MSRQQGRELLMRGHIKEHVLRTGKSIGLWKRGGMEVFRLVDGEVVSKFTTHPPSTGLESTGVWVDELTFKGRL